ncbi:MAG: LamG domain-containing protein [Verrucomicrobia bacterium]|nr:LamG domain-containing protein [Verrucomicrobiota bacterium]
MKWRATQPPSVQRFFTFGRFNNNIQVGQEPPTCLAFLINNEGTIHSATAEGIIELNTWYHVAAVSGPEGMTLYCNGVLVASNAYTGSLAAIGSSTNRLGRTGFPSVHQDRITFDGQIDEFRVWKTAWTEHQIRENMFNELTGKEPDLVGLWNFERIENGLVKDAGAGGHHGKLLANAKVVEARLPVPTASTRTQRVLDLDGKGSYVALPPHIFTNLSTATVEGWVKWRSPRTVPLYLAHFFGFNITMGVRPGSPVNADPSGVELWSAGEILATPGGVIELQEWLHIAAVSGRGGMKLYCNGVLVAANDHRNPFDLNPELLNAIGWWQNARANAAGETTLNGQVDELRVWNRERSEQEIRDNMFKNLTGKEVGLVALWNFNDRTANDSSKNAFHGQFVGNAKVVEAELPAPKAPLQPEKALQLEGSETGVALPENIFTNLASATVEAWVKFQSDEGDQRVFTFGAPWDNLGIRLQGGNRLNYFLAPKGTVAQVNVEGLVVLQKWHHIAAVSGKTGMKLFCDGVLVGTNEFTGSFNSINGQPNWLGRASEDGEGRRFDGQLDEVRVWNRERTEREIRDSMFRNLTGREAGLVAI